MSGQIQLRRETACISRPGSPTATHRRSSALLDFLRTPYRDDDTIDSTLPVSHDRRSLESDSGSVEGYMEGEKRSSYRSLASRGPGSPRGSGYFAWQDSSVKKRRSNASTCAWTLLCLGAASIGWLGGMASKPNSLAVEATTVQDLFHSSKAIPCNPYDQHGVLLVNSTYEPGNIWSPVMAPPNCEPVNYITKISELVRLGINSTEIEFLRDQIVVLFGDSVDRDHNEHMCNFMGGNLELIDVVNPHSPPYPKGQELPPKGYKNPWNGKYEWPSYHQSRPIICHVWQLNLRILNVFHYGLDDRDDFIEKHPHYYPPARAEDRFDLIVRPIVASISDKFNITTPPAVVSVTNGFWGFLRHTNAVDEAAQEAEDAGVPEEIVDAEHDPWHSLKPSEQLWYQRRTTELLRHVAKAWPSSSNGSSNSVHRPKILWRALHHIREHRAIPFNRLEAVDQIGRAVVEQLIYEGRAAEAGDSSWLAWSRAMKRRLRISSAMPDEKTILKDGLGSRLKLDRWADMMLGQERHFRDNVHPLPVPGSFVYGNSLFQNVKEALYENGALELSTDSFTGNGTTFH